MASPDFDNMSQDEWRSVLEGKHPALHRGRHLFGLLPANPRCKVCNAPFGGMGGKVMRLMGRGPFEKNPNFCEACLVFTERKGVEIEISMLFADVRGSTGLAGTMTSARSMQQMNRFFEAAMKVLVHTDAWVDRLIGDEVVALYIPGFAGQVNPQQAVTAARQLLRVTGRGKADGPWMLIGVGVYTDNAYVELVGSTGGVSDLTAMRDAMSVTARLTSLAKPGEVLISQSAFAAAGLSDGQYERRSPHLKGRTEPIEARVLRVDSP